MANSIITTASWSQVANAGVTGTVTGITLSNTAALFDVASAVTITESIVATSFGNDTADVSIRIMSGATVLAAADAGGTAQEFFTGISTTTALNNSFTYVNTTADKAAWDAATVEITQTYNKAQGNDGGYISGDGFSVDVTHTTTATQATVADADATGEIDPVVQVQDQNPVFGDADATGAVDPVSAAQLQYLASVDADSTGEIGLAEADSLQYLILENMDSVGAIDGAVAPAVVATRISTVLANALTLAVDDADSTGAVDTLGLTKTQSLTVDDTDSTGEIDPVTHVQLHKLVSTDIDGQSAVELSDLRTTALSMLGLPTVSRIFKNVDDGSITLQTSDITGQTQIDTFIITQKRAVFVDDVDGAGEIDPVAAQQVHEAAVEDIEGVAEIDLAPGNVTLHLTVVDLTSTGDIETAEQTQTPLMVLDDITAAGTIDTVDVDTIAYIPLEDIEGVGETDPVVITQTRNITVIDIEGVSEIENKVILTTQELQTTDIDGNGTIDEIKWARIAYTVDIDGVASTDSLSVQQRLSRDGGARAAILISV